jgi:glycosyltransferase involved in cell wall biosynthesis
MIENTPVTDSSGLNDNKSINPKIGTLRDYRVLHVTPSFPPDKGGIADHVSNLSRYMNEQGNDVSIITPKHLNNKIQRTALEGSENTTRIRSFYLLGWPYPTLRNISIPIDLGLKIDSIIQNGSFDVIHVHGQHYPISWIALNSAHKHNIPSVLTVHGTYALNPKVLGGKTRFEEWFNKHVFTRILTKTTAVIGLTKQVTDYAKQFGEKSTHYYTVGNGVNTRLYKKNLVNKKKYRLKYGIDPEAIVILFRGRFDHNKSVIEFAKAAKKIIKYDPRSNKVEVVVVGGGPLESEVYSILRDVEDVHLLNYQPYDQVHELYIASDIFVIPSKYEGLPIALVEAMNAFLHIVYTSVGGMPDILRGYFPQTKLANTSSEEIHRVLTSLLAGFQTGRAIDNESITYAQSLDWTNIALSVSKIYAELKEGDHTPLMTHL